MLERITAPKGKSMNDPISIKGLPWLLKIAAAILGAILALILSGDIDTEGRIKITVGVILKFTISVAISLYGGSAFIEYYQLTSYSLMSQGFVMLIFAVFGMLMIGIWYQSLQLWKGKTVSEIIAEVKAAFSALFK
ncbi:hypothetical protein F946_03165 [Acinetobacter johnsonii ANC 3681]|jgi:hypothetical protein|uniref:Uncharacterized protein n=3 Tax=Acinetobacter TaxID=469 RepID=N9BE04_ACIJO|nr:hypothetical protein F946_03165 [Acinetobacter johnsonii ANC 3681]